MAYRALRRDLTEETQKCHFCPNHLTSLKAYVLEDLEDGRLVFAGPTCARNHIGPGESLSNLPDLTKFTDTADERGGTGGGGAGGGAGKDRDDRKFALEYLLLREHKLADELRCSYPPLREYYIQSLSRPLTDTEISHIVNIEAKAPESLRLIALQRCYNYLFWIDAAIARLQAGKTDFLLNVRSTLIRKREISPAQKDGVNGWLKNIAGVPQLK